MVAIYTVKEILIKAGLKQPFQSVYKYKMSSFNLKVKGK